MLSYDSETFHLTSKGLGEMFEGDLKDMCAENFRWCRLVAEQGVPHAQIRERGPSLAAAEILVRAKCVRPAEQLR